MRLLSLFSILVACWVSACDTANPCVEKINPDCVCTMEYDPVCGCNNKTYSNACVAECSGIKTYTKGECGGQAPVALEGPVWKLAQIVTTSGAEQVPANIDIHLKFETGKVSGKGGCNTLGGNYTVNGSELSFSGLMSTKMYCEQSMNWETRFLQMLEKSQIFAINGNELELTCTDLGTLIFNKVP